MIDNNLTPLKLSRVYDVYVKFAEYNTKYNNSKKRIVAIEVKDREDGCPIVRATVNVPEVSLEEGYVLVKNYGENTGVLPWLEENKIVEPTGKMVSTGFEFAHLCKLLRTS
jgi:hypothetical protein